MFVIYMLKVGKLWQRFCDEILWLKGLEEKVSDENQLDVLV